MSQAGDAFSASNMNDLEDRIDEAFKEVNAKQELMIKWPDYGNVTQINPIPQSYTATQDCWFTVYVHRNSILGAGTVFQIFIENTLIDAFSFTDIPENTRDIYISMARSFPLRRGDTVKFVNSGWKMASLTIVPFK